MAYAGLADAYELLSIGFSSKPPAEYLDAGEGHGPQGARDGRDAWPRRTPRWPTPGGWATWTGSGAEREFKRALELTSSYVMAHEWYAEYLAALGRHDEALAEARRAQQLDPLAVPVNRTVGWVLYFGRRYDEADRGAAEDPGDERRVPRRPPGALVGLRREGRHDQAIADIRREVEKPGLRTVKKLMLAYACAAAGEQGGGQRATSGSWSPSWRASPGWLCCRHSCSPRWARRIGRSQQLERAFEIREPGPAVPQGRSLGRVRCGRDPRYGALVEKLGLS